MVLNPMEPASMMALASLAKVLSSVVDNAARTPALPWVVGHFHGQLGEEEGTKEGLGISIEGLHVAEAT